MGKEQRYTEISNIHSFVTLLDTVLENYPQAVVMTSFMFLSLQHETIKRFFENNLTSLFESESSQKKLDQLNTDQDAETQWYETHEAIISVFAISTVLSLVLVVRRIRNRKMLPQTPGLIGTCIQMIAILCLLAPKVFLVSTCLIFAPYFFPVCYSLEYLVILVYNKILSGTCQGLAPETLVNLCVPAFFKFGGNSESKFEARNKNKMINLMNKYGFAFHSIVLYLTSGLFIYLPTGLVMRQLFPESDTEKGLELSMLMWYIFGSYFGGLFLYLGFAYAYYRFGHELKFYRNLAKKAGDSVAYD